MAAWLECELEAAKVALASATTGSEQRGAGVREAEELRRALKSPRQLGRAGDGVARHCQRDLLVARQEADVAAPDAGVAEPEGAVEAVRRYAQRFGQLAPGEEEVRPSRPRSFGWKATCATGRPAAEVALVKQPEAEATAGPTRGGSEASTAESDSDGSEKLCGACGLPLGEAVYTDKQGCLLHRECMNQRMASALKKADVEQQLKDQKLKQKTREEYLIGWSAEQIPRNAGVALKLECGGETPQGMCCLVLDEASNEVHVAPTGEPAAALNLEYLAIALQVRRKDGKEPFFSLDPLGNCVDDGLMQSKRFDPEWLAGTSVGEVLFQADYHLKELSMGSCEQPVIGMKSALDFFEEENGRKEFVAREWFVVRQADVVRSADNALIPLVTMGVEAREQVRGPMGLEDMTVTRPNHPLVKYAEFFTRNFDLIAERRSVVYHLRELAKAAVLAKYLLESQVSLADAWFQLAGESPAACPLEVPQLWNERYRQQIEVHDGAVVDEKSGTHMRAMYGGVQFGLEKFTVGARAASASVQFARIGARGPMPRVSAALSMATSVTGGLRTPAMRGAVSMRAGGVPRAAISMRAGGVPRGVDLSLDSFSLGSARAVHGACVAAPGSAEARCAIGCAFWDTVDSSLEQEDAKLLQDIFNPRLSDRRCEREQFVPPDTSASYVKKLRGLVGEERNVQDRRKEHFFGAGFSEDSVGPLFPPSWKSPIKIAGGPPDSQPAKRRLRATELEGAAALVGSAEAAFDEATEDGVRFRIYKVGTLEVRTIQEAGGPELVGAAFSLAPQPRESDAAPLKDDDKIAKAVLYVEWAEGRTGFAYFTVLETGSGGVAVLQKHPDGSATWEESPPGLEARYCGAKALRTASAHPAGPVLSDARAYAARSHRTGCAASASVRRRFAEGALDMARRRARAQATGV
ncbi:unnamed protein product [Prorocentrum cordatum]|uniref:Uncharacterized protein n=1 Tax=Prorocentrum cordatum TaxID=2364126 RepID=A0ABN9WZV6_9DINO|nr:unnamed protein product [Polarella glacialis]